MERMFQNCFNPFLPERLLRYPLIKFNDLVDTLRFVSCDKIVVQMVRKQLQIESFNLKY